VFGFKKIKICQICGMDIKQETSIKKFGKHFCSNSCAEKYLEKKAIEKQNKPRGGCC